MISFISCMPFANSENRIRIEYRIEYRIREINDFNKLE